jgi:hypothetical protein
MITLTTPKVVNTVLGGSTTVNYDKVVITNLTYDILLKRINGQIKLVCTADSSQTPILGTIQIYPNANPQIAQVDFPSLPFTRTVGLNAGQITSVLGWFDTVQAQVESGLVSVGIIAGTQSTGV